MKTTLRSVLFGAVLIGGLLATPAMAQNIGKIKQGARTAAAGISVRTSNGSTTITYQGKDVWTGKTQGQVTGLSKAVGGVTYAAAFDGKKVIWENTPGAGAKVK